jgi:hypothetical protein
MKKVRCGHCKSEDVNWTESSLPNGKAVYILVCNGCGAALAATAAPK